MLQIFKNDIFYVVIIFISIFLMDSMVFGQSENYLGRMTKFKGDYFGQKPPTADAKIFLPELFNQYGYVHGKLAFSPDGKEVFCEISTSDKGKAIDYRLFMKQH